jgi:hypothetical protein
MARQGFQKEAFQIITLKAQAERDYGKEIISHLLSLLEDLDSRIRECESLVVLFPLLAENENLLSQRRHLVEQLLQVLPRKLDQGLTRYCHFRRLKNSLKNVLQKHGLSAALVDAVTAKNGTQAIQHFVSFIPKVTAILTAKQ